MRLARRLRPRDRGLGRVGGLALLVLAARSLPAQAIGQGFELERVGQFEKAAAIYFATLRAEPTNLSALLGLERVLPGLSRLPELLPVAQRATTASPTNAALRSVLLRTYVELSEPDSARAVAQRWIVAAPRDEAPYREWAMALEDQRRHDAARAVLVDGRRALGRPEAFGIELAELAERRGDWEGAAREWAAALSGAPAQLPYAASELGQAPAPHRDRIARVLTAGDPPPLTRRLAGELLLNWGQPERAWAVYAPTLATPWADAAAAARHFADLAAVRTTPAARRVRALALARYAELAPGPVAVRARAEAARALLEIGDRVAARGVLEAVARDSAAPADAQALAQTTLVAALIDGGQLDEAAQRLARDDRLTAEDRATLRLRLARGRIAQGDLDRANATLAQDSSVEALALKGWIALYRGSLKDAEQLFSAAGPYAGDRRDATDRTEMLALLERVAADSFAELGGALLALARGDSVRAVAALRRAADQPLAGATGRPDILLLAGRVGARLGPAEQQAALAVFDEVVRTAGSGAAAPAAELEWARLLEQRLEPAAAIQHLEHLILSYPGSAVVPEARRELDRAKGAIPKS
jgi:predicted negative regulator of RcsB-dependent stress response